MKKHLIAIGMTLMLLAVGFSGCNEKLDPEKLILGSWIRPDGRTITFYKNGSHYKEQLEHNFTLWCSWSIYEDTLTEYIYGVPTTFTYEFGDNGNKLIWSDDEGQVIIYTRIE